MQITAGPRHSLPPKTWDALSIYLRRVIEVQLSSAAVCEPGVEFDEFDTEAAIYAVLEDEQGRVSACARMLRTTRPHVIGQRYASYLVATPPSGADVWEVSYFYARGPIEPGQRSAPPKPREALELLSGVLTFSRHLNAKRLMFRASPGVISLMRRLDLEVEVLSTRSVWMRGRRYEIASVVVPKDDAHLAMPAIAQ